MLIVTTRNLKGLKSMKEMAPNTWCRAFFSDFPKCDILLNNTCEVFNRYILDARELPILSMCEKIRAQLMHRHYSKKKEAIQKWNGHITPKIRDKLRKNTEFSQNAEVTASGKGEFAVESFERDYIVQIYKRECSCRRWQLTGIPCSHAIACLRAERIKPESMVSSCYTLKTYMAAYGEQIFPLRDKEDWAHVEATPILPPLYEKCAGRRKKNRRKQPEESEDGTRLSKHGVRMHCGYCREPGHNRAGCSKHKASIIRENEVAAEHVQQEGAGEHIQPENEEMAGEHGQPENEVAEEHVQHDVAKKRQISKGKGPATQVEAKNVSRRGRPRKPTAKAREQMEHLLEIARRKKSKQVLDENGDIDFPIIRTHIQPLQVRPHLDPQNLPDTMVNILSHEVPTKGIPAVAPVLPEESSFVAEHRANIPAPRGPQVNTSGRALGRGRGRGTGNVQQQTGASTGAGRGRGTGRAQDQPGATRGVGRGSRGGTRRRGRGLGWYLFGDDSSTPPN